MSSDSFDFKSSADQVSATNAQPAAATFAGWPTTRPLLMI